MSINQNEFSFSPKSTQHNFSPQVSPEKLINHLELKKDRHEALKNYYLTVIDQLKDFTRVSIQQLEDQKRHLIEEIDKKFKDSVKDIRRRAIKKETELNEKLQEAVYHYDQTSILIKKLEVLGSESNLIKEAEENLKSWAREVEVKSSNVVFPVPSLIMNAEYSEYTNLGKVKISGLLSDISPLHVDDVQGVKMLVPFGYPEYSNYFVLKLGGSQTCQTIITSLSQYFGIENIGLSFEQGGQLINEEEKISDGIEVYLVISIDN